VTRLNSNPHAGHKAPSDVARIAEQLGFRRIDLPDFGGGRAWQKGLVALRSALQLMVHAPQLLTSRVIAVQYPLGRGNDLLLSLAVRRAASVALVHDLESLRVTEFAAREAKNLAPYDALIVHSAAMRAYVDQLPPADSASVVLGPFDYLTDVPLPPTTDRPGKVYVIGHLRADKIGYLRGTDRLALPVELFGPGLAADDTELQSRWRGVLPPHAPRLEARNGFGLVWDGPSGRGLEDTFGEYLRYNSPHKFSLYMALGIPVIVSEDSALAPFVRTHGIGYAVSSVAAGVETAANCTPGDWAAMIEAVAGVRESIVSGGRTRRAIAEAVDLALARH
jgi:hypothetical protein